jgi:hypothetical protein
MRKRLVVLASVAVLLAGSTSSAAPRLTTYLDATAALVAQMREFSEVTPRQRHALAASAGLLRRRTSSIDAEMLVAERVTRILRAAFPNDSGIWLELETAISGYGDHVANALRSLDRTLFVLPEGRAATRARGRRDKAMIRFLANQDEASLRRLGDLRRAWRQLELATRAAFGRGDWCFLTSIGAPLVASEAAATATSSRDGRHVALSFTFGDAEASHRRIEFVLDGVMRPSVFDLEKDDASYFECGDATTCAKWTTYGRAQGAGGAVTVTKLDAEARLVEGYFDFAATDGRSLVTVEHGRFRVHWR